VQFVHLVLCDNAGVQDSGIHQQTSPVQQTSVHFEAPVAAPIVQQQQQQAPTSPHPVTATNADTTFRQPLPPALVRPRLPSQGSVVIRGPAGVRHPLQGLDPRLQVPFHYISACIDGCIVINLFFTDCPLHVGHMHHYRANTAFHVWLAAVFTGFFGTHCIISSLFPLTKFHVIHNLFVCLL
jgi:hypothetical protein